MTAGVGVAVGVDDGVGVGVALLRGVSVIEPTNGTSGDTGAKAGPSGVKGLFVAEIVRALQEGDVDLAVHSAKDLPSEDPDGVGVAAVPERSSPFDVLVTRDGTLREGSRVGSSSLRRRGQLARSRPDLKVVDLSIFKNTPVGGRNLQFRLEIFNLFNRANFATPNSAALFNADGTRIPNATNIVRTTTSARQVQLGLKFVF